MFDLNHTDQAAIQTQSLARVLRNIPFILPIADHKKLQEHLEDCECALRPSSKLLAYVRANKLMNTRPVDHAHQSDLVVGGAFVTYAIDGADPQTGLLVHRARAGLPGGVIPVASLLGATLIGVALLRLVEGAGFYWDTREDQRRMLTVINVEKPALDS